MLRRQVAQQITEWREKAGITPEVAAHEVGITVDELLLYENAEAGIPLYLVARIAEVYRADPLDIMKLVYQFDEEPED